MAIGSSSASTFTSASEEPRLTVTDLGRALMRAERTQDVGSGDVIVLAEG